MIDKLQTTTEIDLMKKEQLFLIYDSSFMWIWKLNIKTIKIILKQLLFKKG